MKKLVVCEAADVRRREWTWRDRRIGRTRRSRDACGHERVLLQQRREQREKVLRARPAFERCALEQGREPGDLPGDLRGGLQFHDFAGEILLELVGVLDRESA